MADVGVSHGPARRSSSQEGPTCVASKWALAVAVAGSALAVGTVHTITLCIVGVVLAVAAVLAWWPAEPMRVRTPATVLLLTGIGLTAYTVLQCVPVPISWLAVLAPHNADVWSRALAPWREPGPSWVPVSLDATATRAEVLKGIVYLLAFVTALRVARTREGVGFLSGTIIVTAVTLAVAALVHPAFGTTKLYGVYDPGPGIMERHVAPLINPNNLAGYVNIAICLAVANLLSPATRVPRPIVGAGLVFLCATQVWIASRGGLVTMVMGILIVVVIHRLVRARSQRRAIATLSLAAGIAGAIGGVLIVLGSSDQVATELLETDTSKLSFLRQAFAMLPAVRWLGCGRGAFESAFPFFRTMPGYITFSYPENLLAQWTLEWGVPVGIAGLIGLFVGLRPTSVLARSSTAAGGWAGLAALAVQNLGDLGTEVPGLMLAAVLCAAVVVAGSPGTGPRRRVERWSERPRAVACVAGLAASAALLAVAFGIGGELHRDQRSLHDEAVDTSVPFPVLEQHVRGAMLRHPAEPYIPFAAAIRSSAERDVGVILWVGATLERAKIHGPAHLLLAKALWRRSPSQARLEYRLSIEQAPELLPAAMADAPQLVASFDDAVELTPSGKLGTAVLEPLIDSIADRLPATCSRLDSLSASRGVITPHAYLRAATAAVQDIESGDAAPWCSAGRHEQCVSDAWRRIADAESHNGSTCATYELRARLRVALGDPDTGFRSLENASVPVEQRRRCLQALANLAMLSHSYDWWEIAVDHVIKAGCDTDSDCAANLSWAGQQEEAMNKPATALTLYRRALERAPADDSTLQHVALLASQQGLHAEAAEDYVRLSKRHPAEERWVRAADAEREAAVAATITQ